MGFNQEPAYTGWLGTTLVSKYRVERWKRGRTVHGLGRGRSEEVRMRRNKLM